MPAYSYYQTIDLINSITYCDKYIDFNIGVLLKEINQKLVIYNIDVDNKFAINCFITPNALGEFKYYYIELLYGKIDFNKSDSLELEVIGTFTSIDGFNYGILKLIALLKGYLFAINLKFKR